jgi:hypothetical protein
LLATKVPPRVSFVPIMMLSFPRAANTTWTSCSAMRQYQAAQTFPSRHTRTHTHCSSLVRGTARRWPRRRRRAKSAIAVCRFKTEPRWPTGGHILPDWDIWGSRLSVCPARLPSIFFSYCASYLHLKALTGIPLTASVARPLLSNCLETLLLVAALPYRSPPRAIPFCACPSEPTAMRNRGRQSLRPSTDACRHAGSADLLQRMPYTHSNSEGESSRLGYGLHL